MKSLLDHPVFLSYKLVFPAQKQVKPAPRAVFAADKISRTESMHIRKASDHNHSIDKKVESPVFVPASKIYSAAAKPRHPAKYVWPNALNGGHKIGYVFR